MRVPAAQPVPSRVRTIRLRLRELANPQDAAVLRRFFKTGPGEYGAGDVFLGIRVPRTRALLREFPDAGLEEARALLTSAIHEERLLALLLLVRDFARSDEVRRGDIYRFYMGSTRHINNWDLVDTSAEHIVGGWLSRRNRAPLTRLAHSASVWERRIAIMSTFHFIKSGEADETLRIARLLLDDPHDLIHKAVGWMLREGGKRVSIAAEEAFLRKHAHRMPRTMLRYAIERFPEPKRRAYLGARR